MKGTISFKKIYSSSSDILNMIPDIEGYSLSSAYQTSYCDNARVIFLQSLFFPTPLWNALILHNTTPRTEKTP